MGKKKERVFDRRTCQVFRLIPHTEAPEDDNDHESGSVAQTTTTFRNEKEKYETQAVYGIDYQDEYDYMQHLRTTGAHIVEMQPVAMANKLPRKSIKESDMPGFSEDPEVMCELLDPDMVDEDIDRLLESDNELDADDGLDDDFVIKADAVIAPDDSSFSEFRAKSENSGQRKVRMNVPGLDEDDDDEASEPVFKKPQSSNLKRKLPVEVEQHFEKVLEGYDNEDDFPSDDDDSIDSDDDEREPAIVEVAQEWKDKAEETKERMRQDVNDHSDNTEITKKLVARMNAEDDQPDLDRLYVDDDNKKEKWDCESILTTASTLYNHPQSISEPKLPRVVKLDKHGIPVDPKRATGRLGDKLRRLNDEAMDTDDDDASVVTTRSKASTYRPPNESKEDRRARKKAVKQERKERREEKKINKLAFKQEYIRHHQNKTSNPAGGVAIA